VVVGSTTLRFAGTLALVQKSAEITKSFLVPIPLQFAVGLAGGCELMGAAIGALLSEHIGWFDVTVNAKNEFNSFCRSRMWGPLLENFPDLAARVRQRLEHHLQREQLWPLRGPQQSARQGCSWGSLLYCLTIHLLLNQLADEFPGCIILAFADNVHIIGPPELAAAAYERWRFL